MSQNNPVKIAVTFRTKIALVVFGLFLFFVLLEVSLRFGGFILLSMQEYRNIQSIKQKGAYRILCLGESTTEGQYPQFLEENLNQRNIGVRFSVLDKGSAGTNSPVILSQVDSYLNEYHPDMVVAMMGINDWGERIPFETATTSEGILFIRSFKTYKLIRLLWLHILTKAKETGLYKLNQDRHLSMNLTRVGLKGDFTESIVMESSLKKAIEINPKNDYVYVKLGELYLYQGKYPQAEDLLKKSIEINPKNDYAYCVLGRLCRDQEKFYQSEDALRKAVELNPKNDNAYDVLGWLYLDYGKFSQSEDAFKKAMDLNPKNDWMYGRMWSLYEKMGKSELAKEYAQKASRLRLEYYNPVTVCSYRKLKGILDKRWVKLVCVQYPMRNVEPLKKIFEQDESIIFVDNESVFKEALQKASYNEYFVDMFAGDFGHCTKKGNRLLAENIANTILREVFHK
jgi:tetratricopeptide (TPR) repeat protein